MASNSLMEKYLFYFFGVSIVCGFTAGCAWIEPWLTPAPAPVALIEKTSEARKSEALLPTPSAPSALTADAVFALQSAEAQVVEARKMRTLWPTAVVALDNARSAAGKFDSTGTITYARHVIALCALSLEQRSARSVAP